MGPTQCSSCGKFRKNEDVKARSFVSHDRLEQWWEPVCWWCMWFEREEADDGT